MNEFVEQQVSVMPTQQTVKPMDKLDILVMFTANLIGNHDIEIAYEVRKHEYSSDIVSEQPQFLMKISYSCAYPILKIVDINVHNFGVNFSKVALWKILNIDEYV